MLTDPIINQLNERFDETAPHCFFYETTSEKSKQISKILKKAYFPYDIIDVRSISSLSQVKLQS